MGSHSGCGNDTGRIPKSIRGAVDPTVELYPSDMHGFNRDDCTISRTNRTRLSVSFTLSVSHMGSEAALGLLVCEFSTWVCLL
ncbi:MAG: hypothetical protein J07HQX50_01867 [Haloquadratum sp. J07HQX50]|nr:MAG: hypothetical protein J07HQX50_01867 [Haloquadratum sp. J07HQX50]